MEAKLNRREQSVLDDIAWYKGRYSKYWTEKTTAKLVEKGLVRIEGPFVVVVN